MADIEVFDFHFHGYNFGKDFSADGNWTDKVRKYLENGETRGILCCTDLRTKNEDFETNNQDLFDLAKEKGKSVLPLAAMLHPGEKGWQDIAKNWFDNHEELVAIKMKPGNSRCEITPEIMDPVFDFALERDLFIVCHTEPVEGLSAGGFYKSLRRRPETRLVLYHGSKHEECAFMANCFKNVYVEPCWLGLFPSLFDMMKKLGGYRKLLAGTDGPGWFANFEGSPYQDLVDIARKLLPDEETVKDFCSRNALKFLGIEE